MDWQIGFCPNMNEIFFESTCRQSGSSTGSDLLFFFHLSYALLFIMYPCPCRLMWIRLVPVTIMFKSFNANNSRFHVHIASHISYEIRSDHQSNLNDCTIPSQGFIYITSICSLFHFFYCYQNNSIVSVSL